MGAWRLPRQMPGPLPEPPAWVRVFERAAWSTPDDWEQQMAGGGVLPEDMRAWHAQRRWVEARNEWYRQHPEADNRLEELRERRARRRAASG
jgi:hypothetical protein